VDRRRPRSPAPAAAADAGLRLLLTLRPRLHRASSARSPTPTTHGRPAGLPLDPAIHLQTEVRPPPNPRRAADPDEPPPDPPEPVEAGAEPLPPPHDDGTDDAAWIGARLAELAPVSVDEFYSLTTRFETLELILQLLATRRAHAGYDPYTYTVQDYLHAFS
jgi:hypothetical protein